LISVLGVTCALCLDLLRQGVLTRGGITKGLLYHSSNIAFGPALIEAYRLESEVAVYPRVVLDPTLTKSIVDNQDRTCLCFCWPDPDDLLRLHYLTNFVAWSVAAYENESMGSDLSFVDVRQQVRDALMFQMRQSYSTRVLQKINWLVSYYNETWGGEGKSEIRFNHERSEEGAS